MSLSQDLYAAVKIDADPSQTENALNNACQVDLCKNVSDFKRFPFNNFTYCLTLFSKFFSSFPRGTCSLSVSRQYLALDGIYHPFRAAFPNNSTLRVHITRPISLCQSRDYHPL